MPVNDLIFHEDQDCPCGPRTIPVSNLLDGGFGWVIVHHSLDGRERYESTEG